MLCAVAFFTLFSVFQSVFVMANAEESTVTYSDVMTDLQKDENFIPDDYPSVADDYSMQVIQIAESVDKELFIYVYQPSAGAVDLTAATVSMYNGYSENGKDFSPTLYDLTMVSSKGVFQKYVVKDYTVSTDTERWYNIVMLQRLADKSIDKDIVNGATETIGIAVGQQWRFYNYNDEIKVERGTFKTLYIDIVTADNLIFKDGLTMGGLAGLFNYGDAHFVSFNVEEYVIKHIYDADVSYKSRTVTNYYGMGVPDDRYSEYKSHTVTLYDTDTATHTGSGWGGKTYTWNRISKSSDFISNLESQKVDVSNCKAAVLSSQWTFAFCETARNTTVSNGWTISSYTEVSNVSVLRLHFVDFRGNYYNLGTVSNSVTEDDIPGGIGDPLKDTLDDFFASFTDVFTEIISWILGLVLLVLLVIVLLTFAPSIFSLLAKGIGSILKCILVILLLPVKLLKKLFKRE